MAFLKKNKVWLSCDVPTQSFHFIRNINTFTCLLFYLFHRKMMVDATPKMCGAMFTTRTRHQEIHKFSRNLEATSKFKVPQGWNFLKFIREGNLESRIRALLPHTIIRMLSTYMYKADYYHNTNIDNVAQIKVPMILQMPCLSIQIHHYLSPSKQAAFKPTQQDTCNTHGTIKFRANIKVSTNWKTQALTEKITLKQIYLYPNSQETNVSPL